MWSSRHGLDWANQPLPFKIYTSLAPIPLPVSFSASETSAFESIAGVCAPPVVSFNLEMLARLCYFSNGVTRVLQGMPFRAAACTGALYHIELYAVCGDLTDLEAGVYHFGAHDNALRQLRRGDFRRALVWATGDEPSMLEAPVILAFTSTWWRNAWKYQARTYRHAFWDAGTVLANLLAVTCAHGMPARLVQGFADAEVNRLLDVDPAHEATICLVPLGDGAPPAVDTPPIPVLALPTQRLSHHEVDYPLIVSAQTASSLDSGAEAAAWRNGFTAHKRTSGESSDLHVPLILSFIQSKGEREGKRESIESVILRRGSSRQFAAESITDDELRLMMDLATAPIPADVGGLTQPYVIVNAVEWIKLGSGAYVFDRSARGLDLLKPGEFRREAAHLDLGQELAGDAAVNVYWLADLESVTARLGNRGYRAAQLEAAVEGGKLYLAAYAAGLGATGLTFFDDDVTHFFSPHAAAKSVLFLTAVGRPAKRRR